MESWPLRRGKCTWEIIIYRGNIIYIGNYYLPLASARWDGVSVPGKLLFTEEIIIYNGNHYLPLARARWDGESIHGKLLFTEEIIIYVGNHYLPLARARWDGVSLHGKLLLTQKLLFTLEIIIYLSHVLAEEGAWMVVDV